MYYKKRVTVLLISLAVFCIACQNQPQSGEDWQLLFDGKALDGWIVNGGEALYRVEDSMLVCSIDFGVEASYLCTEKSYDNFVLEYEVKIDSVLNSGVQIRSHVWEKDTVTDYNSSRQGLVKQNWKAGQVWGYQIDLDPTRRAWSGGLYEEGNRGWLVTNENNEAARKAFKRAEWNYFKVEANGDRIRTWVNGVAVVDTVDKVSSNGFIGIQVHEANEKQAGKKIYWRNIRIQQL